jgi:hypothetical protein
MYVISSTCLMFTIDSSSYTKVVGANRSLPFSANLQSVMPILFLCLHDMVCRDKARFISLHYTVFFDR